MLFDQVRSILLLQNAPKETPRINRASWGKKLRQGVIKIEILMKVSRGLFEDFSLSNIIVHRMYIFIIISRYTLKWILDFLVYNIIIELPH